MGTDDIARIERHLENISDALSNLSRGLTRQETKMESVEKKIDVIDSRLMKVQSDGCAHYPEHTKAQNEIDGHEKRIGTLETDKAVVIGIASAAGVAAGVIGSFVGWLMGK